jgi:hypothetical protein
MILVCAIGYIGCISKIRYGKPCIPELMIGNTSANGHGESKVPNARTSETMGGERIMLRGS